jgi:hypothetical protein
MDGPKWHSWEVDGTSGAMAATGEFLDRFNAGDAVGHVATLAFPHIRLASGRVRIGEYPAVYVVVEDGGRWLIQCRSSFAP